uniref:Uncharacterized protein n=1 Tax=Amphimedon queenslandica TaxID=400682 RepID=A0A1X7SID5_AMPQE
MAKGKTGQKTKKRGAPRKPRMTVARKIEATVRVIRGESMESVARSLGVTAADISRWHEAFFDGAACACEEEKIGSQGHEDRETGILAGFDHDGQRVAARADRNDGDGPPFCAQEVDAMSAVISTSTKKAYGVSRVCRVWEINRAGVYRHLNAATADDSERQRPGPVGAMPDAKTRGHRTGHRRQPVPQRGLSQSACALSHTRTFARRKIGSCGSCVEQRPARQDLSGTDPTARAPMTEPSSLRGSMRCGAPT